MDLYIFILKDEQNQQKRMNLNIYYDRTDQNRLQQIKIIKLKMHDFEIKLGKYIKFFTTGKEVKENDKFKKSDIKYIYNLMVLYFEHNEYKEIYERLFNCELYYKYNFFYTLVQNENNINCNICLMDFKTKYYKCNTCTFKMCSRCEPKITKKYLKCVVCKQ